MRLTNLEDRLVPASFVVNLTSDGAGNTLRNQIIASNNNGVGLDTITFDPTVFTSAKTITLTAGEIPISGNLIIQGASNGLTISGNDSSRIFNINGAGTLAVSIQDMTLTKGATTGVNDGGAIFCQDEDLTLTRCTLTDNNSAHLAGALRVEAGGKLTIDTCSITNNTAVNAGGAFSLVGGPTVTIDASTFSSNSGVAGGAVNISAGGALTVTGCTFNSNNATAGDGGALFLNGVFTSNAIRNSTFHGNVASSDAGAISITSGFTTTLNVQNCTLTSNQATAGNGGAIARVAGTGTIGLSSTIVFSNSAGTTADNLFTTGTATAALCLISSTTGVTTFTGDAFTNANLGVNPGLGSLQNNGGPTQTRAITSSSAAFNKGSNAAGTTTDQRGAGYFRTRGKATDIGAFELPDDFVVTNTNNSGVGSLRQAVLDANSAVGVDTIVFDTSVFTSSKTVTLTTGELLVTEFLTINGPSSPLTVSGNNNSRVFHAENATDSASLILTDMTITAGKAGAGNDGGAILTTEPMTLTRVNVTNSSAGDEGGGIRVSGVGSLNMIDCSVSGNSANTGGGIAFDAGTSSSTKSSTISTNVASGFGGGVAILGSAAIVWTNSTLSGNSAANGGGIAWTVTSNNNSLSNCTVTGNSAAGGKGGGMYAKAGTLTLDSTIASDNSASSARDIFNPGTTNVNYCAISSSTGFTLTGGNNLNIGTNLLLGPLQFNGGLTKTHAPAVNSPLLNKGNNGGSLTNDQRGAGSPRLRGAGVDIGAVEADQLTVLNTLSSGAGSIAQAVADSNSFIGRDTITFDSTAFATLQGINLNATLNLIDDVEIQGPAARVTLSGQLANRVLSITGGGLDYDFSNLSIALGKATGDGGGVNINQAGVDVAFTNCLFSFNSTTTQGGAIGISSGSSNANITFSDCTFTSNSTTGATTDGAAIHSGSAIKLNIIRTTMNNNTATGDGGAVSLDVSGSSLLLQDTTLFANSAGLGGGAISVTGAPGSGGLKILNSALSGNKSSKDGGGLQWLSSSGTMFVQNSTITNNTASSGGGGGISVNNSLGGNLNIESTIVSGNSNSGAPDIDNPNTTTLKSSAVGDNLGFVKTDAGGNLPFQPHANLKLGVLTSNGGPTLTHLPQSGSPLINAGSNPLALTNDQRGAPFVRNLGGGVDIGSTEFVDFIVHNTNNTGAGSLRDVIALANAASGLNTIAFDPAVFNSTKTISVAGEIVITDAITIDGPNGFGVILNSNGGALFNLSGAGSMTVNMDELTLQNAKSQQGGAILASGVALTLTSVSLINNSSFTSGGAVYAKGGSLTLEACTVTGNSAADWGGGIAGESLTGLSINNSQVLNNTATTGGGVSGFLVNPGQFTSSTFSGNVAQKGGGIYSLMIATLSRCTVSGNTATTLDGGGIYAFDRIVIDSCTLSNNVANKGYGGGIIVNSTQDANPGELVLRNSTLSGNSAKFEGGGFAWGGSARGTAQIRNCTIFDNSTAQTGGGGVFVSPIPGTATLSIDSAIISGNASGNGSQIYSQIPVNVTTSLIGSKALATLFTGDAFTNANIGVDPQLGPLQNNGGPTLTHLPAFTSPAVNKGSNPAALSVDQRGTGFARTIGGAIDIGAVETHTFVVTNTNNSGAGSLRQAVLDANGFAGADGIEFDPTVFTTAKTITLTTGELAITDSVSIVGPAPGVTVSGNNASRILNINGTGSLTIALSDITLTAGKTTGTNDGGAILVSDESVTLTRVTVSNSVAGGDGGGIELANDGASLTLVSCKIAGNSANLALTGGGIQATGLATILIQDTTISGNSAGVGGGLQTDPTGGSLTIINSTFSSNVATSGFGGAMLLNGPFGAKAIILNSTISGNSATDDGGGIALGGTFSGTMLIQNSTIVQNTAAGGLGGGLLRNSGTGIITLASTIISGNTGATNPDIKTTGTLNANFCAIGNNTGFTLSGSSGNNLPFGTNLKLGALANNGGPTLTHLPAVDSPLVDAGSNPAALTLDQRGVGFSRSLSGLTDIGAVEARAFIVRNINDAGPGSLRQNIIDANGLAGPDTITFDATIFATAKTITLTNGELDVTDSLTITGPAVGVTISGNNTSRQFSLEGPTGLSFTASKLTLTQGKSVFSGGAIRGDNDTITLTDCVLTGNSSHGSGGAVQLFDGGTLNATRCQFTSNIAEHDGGAISVQFTTTPAGGVFLQDCSITGNSGRIGGGIDVEHTLQMIGSTVSGNVASLDGGGIALTGYFTPGLSSAALIVNSTISSNSASRNGGGVGLINFTGNVGVVETTMTANAAADNGGGIGVTSGSGGISLVSSIVQGDKAASGPDFFTTASVSATFSLLGSTSGITSFTGDIFTTASIGANAKLGPLQNNGGLTLTHLPASDSPAVNHGNNFFSAATDQRGIGFPRVIGGATDIGAVETRSFIVTNNNDAGAGSLRQAVLDSNAFSGADTIIFDPTFFATTKTITLTTGQFDITDSATIVGTGPSLLTVSGNNASRIFDIDGPGTVTVAISGMTITAGQATGAGAAIHIANEAVTLTDTVISNSSLTLNNAGGAIFASGGSLTINRSTLSSNSAGTLGGAVAGNGATMLIQDSIFANNTAGGAAAIDMFNGGSLVILNSTISGNTAQSGGAAIDFTGAVTGSGFVIRNSTISGNSAGGACSGVELRGFVGTLLIQNSTITNNSGTNVTAILATDDCVGSMSIESSIVSGNSGGTSADIFVFDLPLSLKSSAIGIAPSGGFTDLGGNLPFGANLKLGPLANNGGPTPTHALLPGSAAINAGSNPAALATDQRGSGFGRVIGGTADIGAFESSLPPTVRSVVINGGAVQRSRVTSVTVTFDSVVAFSGTAVSAFQLKRQSDNAIPSLSAAVTNSATTSVTLTFLAGAAVDFGSLADGRYTLTIDQSKVSANASNLDGDANGVGGDNFVLVGDPTTNKLFRLFGDADGNGLVDGVDFGAFRNAFNSNSNVFDFDGSGVVDGLDFGQFRQRFGQIV